KPALGFAARASGEPSAIARCLLLPPGFEDAPSKLAGAIDFALGAQSTSLLRVGLRVSATSGQTELALWTRPGPCERGFVAKVLASALPTTSLVRVLATGEKKSREVKRVEVLSGKGHWRETLGGLPFRVSAPSFFQVNSAAAQILVERVLDALDAKGRRVADLYCGVGTFTLPLAQRASSLVAAELASSSIRDLRRNLATLKLDVEVLTGDVGRSLEGLTDIEVAVVDPPRGGLDLAVVEALSNSDTRSLVYVSCDPTTLARDARRLIERGWRLTEAQPIDLFPQTWHVESLGRFVR
ncbi:MAG: methyltransferase, partial [Coriobacteriales bacterium]|nr:methyltransferase [Coriobacteriales bacterium]